MIISDISHLEVATEENSIIGGLAIANAYSSAYANGPNFAGTNTSTYTSAYTNDRYYYYYSPNNSASSNSNSSSASS
ncbi:hypothetical protein DSM106972_087910 [Dulcicalothrix desertica PCC 7102]|uniref:Uncharacterized protein n=1 Tax=Dulcicalothrix desertica PCC 7102 TaxID=232991 RepID=A0A3S1C3D4_9CYAN|nr:hypothetical protein [Dulcicalothrix desertica]RUS96249.1 hypothetical protein DSM106972_087910 [Dulcicalothrix desertica PCC 7102]TWH40426.1 hypothetical protein CAL7102_09753 [Dulcicalothrix desertica PCC 7102]